jgi:hypothetical protein
LHIGYKNKKGVADFSATPCCNSDTGLLPKKVIYYSPLCFLEDFELSPEKSTGGRITVSPKDKLK